MTDILEELYLGNLRPLDAVAPQSKDYENARTERSDRIHSLLKKLDSQAQELKEELGEIESYEITQTFIVGFRLGARIMLAIYSDD